MSILNSARIYWANLDPRHRKIILIVGAVLAAIVVVSLVVAIMSPWGRCRFVKTIPWSTSPPRPVVGASGRDMAKLDAYIALNNKYYLALDVDRMTVDRESGTIELEDECVVLSMSLYEFTYEDQTNVVVNNLEWTLKDSTEGSEEPYGRCKVSIPPFLHTFPKVKYRHSCRQPRTHQCDTSNAKVELILKSFELELEGEEEKIRKFEFSKPPYPNSCVQ